MHSLSQRGGHQSVRLLINRQRAVRELLGFRRDPNRGKRLYGVVGCRGCNKAASGELTGEVRIVMVEDHGVAYIVQVQMVEWDGPIPPGFFEGDFSSLIYLQPSQYVEWSFVMDPDESLIFGVGISWTGDVICCAGPDPLTGHSQVVAWVIFDSSESGTNERLLTKIPSGGEGFVDLGIDGSWPECSPTEALVAILTVEPLEIIRIYDLGGNYIESVTVDDPEVVPTYFCWSPDGNRFAVIDAFSGDLHGVNRDGSGLRNLSENYDYRLKHPSWVVGAGRARVTTPTTN